MISTNLNIFRMQRFIAICNEFDKFRFCEFKYLWQNMMNSTIFDHNNFDKLRFLANSSICSKIKWFRQI